MVIRYRLLVIRIFVRRALKVGDVTVQDLDAMLNQLSALMHDIIINEGFVVGSDEVIKNFPA